MTCAICGFDGPQQEELINLKDRQIDELRRERDALAAYISLLIGAVRENRNINPYLPNNERTDK